MADSKPLKDINFTDSEQAITAYRVRDLEVISSKKDPDADITREEYILIGKITAGGYKNFNKEAVYKAQEIFSHGTNSQKREYITELGLAVSDQEKKFIDNNPNNPAVPELRASLEKARPIERELPGNVFGPAPPINAKAIEKDNAERAAAAKRAAEQQQSGATVRSNNSVSLNNNASPSVTSPQSGQASRPLSSRDTNNVSGATNSRQEADINLSDQALREAKKLLGALNVSAENLSKELDVGNADHPNIDKGAGGRQVPHR